MKSSHKPRPDRTAPERRSSAEAPRNDERLFTVEGARAVRSILNSPLVVRDLVVIESEERKWGELEGEAAKRGIPVRRVSERHSRRYFDAKSPQGIAALVEKPAARPVGAILEDARAAVVLDGLSDPGNAGTLVRTALLLGWDAVLFTPGSVDPYHPKTVRASAGAVGYISVASASAEEIRRAANAAGFRTLVAGLGPERAAGAPGGKTLLVLGGEARGPSSAWPDARAAHVAMKALPIDSLGVVASGSILLERFRP